MSFPIYNDGFFELFNMVSDNGLYETKIEKTTGMKICFKEISVNDNLKVEYMQQQIDVTKKIVIPQYKKIKATDKLLIDEEFYEIININHNRNKDNFLETILTLGVKRK